MKLIYLFGAIIASAALAACGGGDSGGEPADTNEPAASEPAAETEAPAEDASDDAGMTADDEAMDDSAMAEEPAADDVAEEPVEDAAEEPAEETDTAAAETGGGEFQVAGLTGDPEAGRRVFTRCMSCHVLEEGVNRVGPSLYGIIDREAGTIEGFRYSDANANSGVVWTEENLFEYLENPREYIPGTIMAFPGLPDPQQRADLIAYIKANGGDAS